MNFGPLRLMVAIVCVAVGWCLSGCVFPHASAGGLVAGSGGTDNEEAREHAVHLSQVALRQQGVDLAKYREPMVLRYSSELHRWTIYYEPTANVLGGGFFIHVTDEGDVTSSPVP
jgi:hypothetical protein